MQLLLTYTQAAQELGFKSTKPIYQLVARNRLTPVYPLTRKYPRIHRDDLIAFVETLKQEESCHDKNGVAGCTNKLKVPTGGLTTPPQATSELGDLLALQTGKKLK